MALLNKVTVLLLLVVLTVKVAAQNRKIIDSDIRWKGYKTLKAESQSHFGTVKLKSGSVAFTGNELTGGSFVIDMNTIDAEDMNGSPKLKKILETHLKNDDFFDTEKFPVASFQIKSVKKTSDKNYPFNVTGVLTIKGINKTISFPVKVENSAAGTTITSAKFSFNRKHFGLKYNVFEDMLISNDVEMNVKLVVN